MIEIVDICEIEMVYIYKVIVAWLYLVSN